MNEYDVPDWLPKAALETDALIRKLLPMLRTAELYVDEARAAQAAAGLSRLSGGEVALAMDAGMRELFAAVQQHAFRQQFEHRAAHGFIGAATRSAPVTGAGNLALAPMALAGVAEASAATGTLAVQDDSAGDLPARADSTTAYLGILWVFVALVILGPVLGLSAEAQAFIDRFVATVGVGLIITWRVNDSRRC